MSPAVPPIVLASASPRRTEILRQMGIPHTVVPSTVDESRLSADHPRTFAIRAAYAKAMEVATRQPEGTLVLAADTVVTADMILYGKPTDPADAARMLRRLAGRAHEVITGVAIARAGSATCWLRSETTRVHFRPLDEALVERYVAGGEPMDKAGAYGIQGGGAALIERIEGDYFNVVGLPCGVVADLLDEAGWPGHIDVPAPPAPWDDQ
jgi:septum formation protein